MRNLLTALATLAVLAAVAVLSPGTVPPALRGALGVGPTPLGSAPRVPAGGTYRFMQHQLGDPGAPVAYDPCKVIHVRVNTQGVRDEAAARTVVLSAMAAVSRDSGLQLHYDGPTQDRARWSSQPRPVLGHTGPVLVTFATSAEVPQLKGAVAGIAGSVSVRRGGVSSYVTGQVTPDSGTFDHLLSEPAFTGMARAIAMHEFGHLVGLAHVPGRRELMYAQNDGQTDFGPGDRRGLALLGQGACS